MLFMLKKEEPSEELVKLLLSREMPKGDRGDPFVTSALRFDDINLFARILYRIIFKYRQWCIDFEEQLSEIIAGLLLSKYPQNSPTKRKRTLKSDNQSNGAPTAEQVRAEKLLKILIFHCFLPQLLGHLEYLRRSCRYGHSAGTALYLHEKMQRALQQAFGHSTEGQKVKFSL